MPEAKRPNLVGAAGEHYVMCQLLRRGMIAALAPQGVPNADIVVTDEIGDRLCAIQVKTRRDIGSDRGWHMKAKHEDIVGDRLFYCFIDFGKSLITPPKCWVVPSAIVASILKSSHGNWLEQPGKKGQPHKDGEMRRFRPDYSELGLGSTHGEGWLEKYYEAWNLLED
ncbi:MAG TPA: hypothetical protein PLQ11_01800 [Beijerinckiaceae bacterium]|nr:hypothetical protein [Beijerinckiaceae bacterium]